MNTSLDTLASESTISYLVAEKNKSNKDVSKLKKVSSSAKAHSESKRRLKSLVSTSGNYQKDDTLASESTISYLVAEENKSNKDANKLKTVSLSANAHSESKRRLKSLVSTSGNYQKDDTLASESTISYLVAEEKKSIKDVNKLKTVSLSTKAHTESKRRLNSLVSTSGNHLKEEIVRSIIDEVLFKCVTNDGSRPASGVDDPPGASERAETPPRRTVATIVKEFQFPVSLSESVVTPCVDGRPTLERLILDTHVTRSSTILTNPEERSRPSTTLDTSAGPANEIPIVKSPLDIYWCFGFNVEVPVVNLSNDQVSEVVYANSQYAVIFDFHENTMAFLQGHTNMVSCIATNVSGDLIVTADAGPKVGSSRVIVWDRHPCVLRVLEGVHTYGCQLVALSPKGDVIVTVSAYESPTCVRVWEWKEDSKDPSVSISVKESLGYVKRLTTHPTLNREFALTFERSVLFARIIWHNVLQDNSDEGRIKELIKDCEFNISNVTVPKVGGLTDTTFVEGATATTALSSTCKGYVIRWENGNNSIKFYRKYVRLNLDRIICIQAFDKMIAIATDVGGMSFYDLDLKLLFSHKPFSEPIASVSFNINAKHLERVVCDLHASCAKTWRAEPKQLKDATLKCNPFSVNHYIASTEAGKIAYANDSSATSKNFTSFPSKEQVNSLDVTPNSKYLCAGTSSGKCMLIDISRRRVKVTRQVNVDPHPSPVTFVRYSPSGFVLACGMANGNIWLLDPLLFTPTGPPLECSFSIVQMVFSPDSDYLFTADTGFTVSAYSLGEQPYLIGKFISHHKPITCLCAEICEDGEDQGNVKVRSMGLDRFVCQYMLDIEQNTFEFNHYQKAELTAIPSYFVVVPRPFSYQGTYLGVNNEGKFKLRDNPYRSRNKKKAYKCNRGTFQAPDFGSPISYMEVFELDSNYYLYFQTQTHIGIHNFPIDGNPFRSLGYKASPTSIKCSKVSPNGKYLLTVSESCSGLTVWRMNAHVVDDFYRSGGEGLQPFLSMMDAQEEKKIREFFDFGQFLHQGERPNLVRGLKDTLPLCELANVLQALGCLLTKNDISDLTNDFLTKPGDPTRIEYDDFVRLYLNFRNTRGIDLQVLRHAFHDFYAGVSTADSASYDEDGDPVFPSSTFISGLLDTGEDMSMAELYADLSILTGGHTDPAGAEDCLLLVPPTVPKAITFKTFIKDILGFQVDDALFKEPLEPKET